LLGFFEVDRPPLPLAPACALAVKSRIFDTCTYVDKFITREGYRMKVIGYATSLAELVALLAERRYSLGITSTALEAAAGLAQGHLSKVECGTKRLGHISLPTLLSALGLKLAVVESDEPLPLPVAAILNTAKTCPAKHRPVTLPPPSATIPAPAADGPPKPAPALQQAA
jgi:transcriptional regulator with XRE-family HTH domain